MSPNRWWVRIAKETRGPFTLEELGALPDISGAAWVSPEGSTDRSAWRRLQEVPEMAKALEQSRKRSGKPSAVPPAPPPEEPDSAAPGLIPTPDSNPLRDGAIKILPVDGPSKDEVLGKLESLWNAPSGAHHRMFRVIFKSRGTGDCFYWEKPLSPKGVVGAVRKLELQQGMEIVDVQDLGSPLQFSAQLRAMAATPEPGTSLGGWRLFLLILVAVVGLIWFVNR